MTDPARILVSGPGLIGRQHMARIAAHPDAELAGIVAPDRPHNRALAGEVPFGSDFEAMLAAVRPDGVILSTPNAVHTAQAEASLRRGIPALVEKPLADTLEQAQRLVALVQETGVPVLVGHHRAHSPLLQQAKALIASEHFGRPVALQGSALFAKPAQYFRDAPWRTQAGGGPILINLIHEIGIMRFLFGEIAEVSAMASTRVRGFDVEDTAALSFAFENGALGTFILSDCAASTRSWEMTSGENPVYPHLPGDTCYHFAGTRGALDFPTLRLCHTPPGAEPSWTEPMQESTRQIARTDPLTAQFDHFVQVIRGQAAPRVSAEDGMRNMAVVDAIQRSMALGQRLRVQT